MPTVPPRITSASSLPHTPLPATTRAKTPFVYIGPNRSRLGDLEVEAEAASALGFAADVLDRTPLPFTTGGALRFSSQAQFNPAKYLVGLAAVAAASGITVFENSRVTSIDPGKNCIVTTNEGIITARDVLVATNTPIASPKSYDARLQPGCHRPDLERKVSSNAASAPHRSAASI